VKSRTHPPPVQGSAETPDMVFVAVVSDVIWSPHEPQPGGGPEQVKNWKHDHVQRWLERRYRAAPHSARAPLRPEHATMLRDYAQSKGYAVCEDCRAIFTITNARPGVIRCPECSRERRNRTRADRRRANRAWWAPERHEQWGMCLGCVSLRVKNKPLQPVPPFGGLYCSDACRKRVARFRADGGEIS
jgi:hypothetical protein